MHVRKRFVTHAFFQPRAFSAVTDDLDANRDVAQVRRGVRENVHIGRDAKVPRVGRCEDAVALLRNHFCVGAFCSIRCKHQAVRIDAAASDLSECRRRYGNCEIGASVERARNEFADPRLWAARAPCSHRDRYIGKNVAHVDDERSAMPQCAGKRGKREGNRREAGDDDIVASAREREIRSCGKR